MMIIRSALAFLVTLSAAGVSASAQESDQENRPPVLELPQRPNVTVQERDPLAGVDWDKVIEEAREKERNAPFERRSREDAAGKLETLFLTGDVLNIVVDQGELSPAVRLRLCDPETGFYPVNAMQNPLYGLALSAFENREDVFIRYHVMIREVSKLDGTTDTERRDCIALFALENRALID